MLLGSASRISGVRTRVDWVLLALIRFAILPVVLLVLVIAIAQGRPILAAACSGTVALAYLFRWVAFPK